MTRAALATRVAAGWLAAGSLLAGGATMACRTRDERVPRPVPVVLTPGRVAAAAAAAPTPDPVTDPVAVDVGPERDRFVARIGSQLLDLDQRIARLDAELATRVGQADTDQTIALTQALATLEHERSLARGSLARARRSGGDVGAAHRAP